jgi:hypothetical protein
MRTFLNPKLNPRTYVPLSCQGKIQMSPSHKLNPYNVKNSASIQIGYLYCSIYWYEVYTSVNVAHVRERAVGVRKCINIAIFCLAF